jgi:hypothetical protein
MQRQPANRGSAFRHAMALFMALTMTGYGRAQVILEAKPVSTASAE